MKQKEDNTWASLTAICIVIIHIKGTFHKIVKSNGVSMSNKNTTFNTIVSASAAINQPQV